MGDRASKGFHPAIPYPDSSGQLSTVDAASPAPSADDPARRSSDCRLVSRHMQPHAGPFLWRRHKDTASGIVVSQGCLGFTRMFIMSQLKHKDTPNFGRSFAVPADAIKGIRAVICISPSFSTVRISLEPS